DQARQSASSVNFDWPMFRGNVSRTASVHGSVEHLSEQWHRSDLPAASQLDARYWVEKSLSQQEYRSDDLKMAAFFPVAAAGKLIYRGFSGIYAADPETGRLLWATPAREGLEALANDCSKNEFVQKWFDKYRQSATEDILFH